MHISKAWIINVIIQAEIVRLYCVVEISILSVQK